MLTYKELIGLWQYSELNSLSLFVWNDTALNMHHKSLFVLFVDIFLGQVQDFWDPVHLAVVRVQLIKLYRLGLVLVDVLENRLHLVVREWPVQSLQDLLELLQTQLPALVGVVCHKRTVKRNLLYRQNVVQLHETLLHLDLQLRTYPHLLARKVFVSLLRRLTAAQKQVQQLVLTVGSQVNMVFLHLLLQFLQWYTAVWVFVHLLEKVYQLLALDVGVYVFK